MCGRYAMNLAANDVQQKLDSLGIKTEIGPGAEDVKPRQNVTPQTLCLVLVPGRKIPELRAMRWSLQPSFMKKKATFPTFNSRSESLDPLKPCWRSARERQCVVVMQGYYEWQRGSKQPYFIHGDDLLFCLGIWDLNEEVSEGVPTFSMLTVPAPTEKMNKLHARMPAIVTSERAMEWTELKWPEALKITNGPWTTLDFYPVTKKVNIVGNEGPNLTVHKDDVKPEIEDTAAAANGPTGDLKRKGNQKNIKNFFKAK